MFYIFRRCVNRLKRDSKDKYYVFDVNSFLKNYIQVSTYISRHQTTETGNCHISNLVTNRNTVSKAKATFLILTGINEYSVTTTDIRYHRT